MKASRSASTRAACKRASRRCAAVLVAALAIATGAGCAPQLIIELVTDPALANAPTFVKFQIGERPKRPEVYEFGPFDVDAIPDEEFAPVEPGVEFFIDVIGCPDGNAANCVEAASFNARGCTPYMTLARDVADATVRIVVKGAVEGDAECPPPP